mgnify:CR=1 FL=1
MLRYGLIGFPLSHSFSEKYFSDKFEAENTAACYKNYPVENLDQLRPLIAEQQLAGLNVTIPYKEKIIPYLDAIEDTAKLAGAVNCIQIRHGLLKGFNTDIIGFQQGFLETLPANRNYKALVLGNGGAAKAVSFCLQQHGISFYTVTRRHIPFTIRYQDIDARLLDECKLLINTTPLGMFPNVHERPDLPYHYVTDAHIAFDLIYNPAQTAFLQACANQKASTKNGLRMLQIQADESYRIFTQ